MNGSFAIKQMATLAGMMTSTLNYRIIKLFCLVVLGMFVAGTGAYAQPKWQLKDVAKIEFITKGHAFSRYYQCHTVLNRGGEWKSYRTFNRKEEEKYPADTDTVFHANISGHDIKALLKKGAGLSSKKDSIKFARPSKRLLTNIVDSIIRHYGYKLTAEKSEYYISLGRKKSFYQKAAQWVIVKPKMPGDANYIIVITKLNDTIKFHGDRNGVYQTPWYVNDHKYYDKVIGQIFSKATSNGEDFEVQKYYKEIYFWIYSEIFTKEKVNKVNDVSDFGLLGSFDLP